MMARNITALFTVWATVGMLANGIALAADSPPVTTKAASAKPAAQMLTWDKLPDWSGIWVMEGRIMFDNSGKDPTRQFPPYKPQYEKKYAKIVADAVAGKEFDPLTYCLPAGFPRVLTEPFLQEFVVRPSAVYWIHEQQNEIRRIYTDGRGHPPEEDLFPLWEGHSIGHWEGDTLVVDTISMREGIFDRSGAPHSDQVHLTERIRKVDAGTIEDHIVVMDPVTMTKPWNVLKRYKKLTDPTLRIDHWACEENNRAIFKDGSTDFILPGEKGYQAPGDAGFRDEQQKQEKKK
jgi:hypothetical protein